MHLTTTSLCTQVSSSRKVISSQLFLIDITPWPPDSSRKLLLTSLPWSIFSCAFFCHLPLGIPVCKVAILYLCHHLIISCLFHYLGVPNLWSEGCIQTRMAVNAAQHKIVNLLKILWDFFVITCHNVFNVQPNTTLLLPVWRRNTKSSDTPAIGSIPCDQELFVFTPILFLPPRIGFGT